MKWLILLGLLAGVINVILKKWLRRREELAIEQENYKAEWIIPQNQSSEEPPKISLDYTKIPEELHYLISYAERFGHSCDDHHEDAAAMANEEDKKAVTDGLCKSATQVEKFLENTAKMTDEQAAFMYLGLVADEEGWYEA